MIQAPPDIVLLAPEWRTRALVRAQLIEEGLEVVAIETWPAMRRQLRPRLKPKLAIVDLKDLPSPDRVLDDLRVLMKPDRVLVLAAMGTIAPADIERLGFRVQRRPFAVGDVVRAAANAIRTDQVSADA
jgi:hypothetical protein